jgi:hypothetical protein
MSEEETPPNFFEEVEEETPKTKKELDEETLRLIYDKYKSGTSIPELIKLFGLDALGIKPRSLARRIKDYERKLKLEERGPGRPPGINPVAYATGKVTSELATKIAQKTAQETNEALDLGIALIEKIRQSAKARNMSPKDYVNKAIDFYETWGLLVEKLKGTYFENFIKEIIRDELYKTATNIQDILLKNPMAIRIEIEKT